MPRKTNLSRRTRKAKASRRARAKQTQEQRLSRNEKQRQRRAQRRAEETPEQRETRLQDARLRTRQRRSLLAQRLRSQHNERQRLKRQQLVAGSNITAIKWGWGKQERKAVEVNQDGGRGGGIANETKQKPLRPEDYSLQANETLVGRSQNNVSFSRPCCLFWQVDSAGTVKETVPARLARMEGGRCTVDLVKLSSASLPTTSKRSLPGTSERSDEVGTLLDPDQRALHKEVKEEDPSRW